MPHTIVEFQATPNPNALKCVLDRPLLPAPSAPSAGPAIRSYRSAAAATDDPLGRALMGVSGVSSVLIAEGWITINKAAGAGWPAIKKEVQRVLAAGRD